MGFFYSKIWCLYVITSATCTAFQVSTLSSCSNRLSYTQQQTIETTSTTISTASLTKLNMGVMEDFLTGQDNNKRTESNKIYLEELQKRVIKINQLESIIEEFDDTTLQEKTIEFKQRLQIQNENINGPILEEAFAVVREASWRVLELRHYDVQLIGGMILHDGRLAEMATGEGKTLVSTLPVYLNSLTGKTSYIITVNDYLARRDMEKMSQIYKFLGLSVGLIQAGMSEQQRRTNYLCDIVYVTNSELGFDYLRDHLALSPEQTVLLRNPNEQQTTGTSSTSTGGGTLEGSFCVVDEADSVLIDEARTPLIISEQIPAPADKYSVANKLANALKKDLHYKVDLKNKNVVLTDTGYEDSERALGVDSLFMLQQGTAIGQAWAPFIVNAIKAKELFTKDIEYTVLTDNDGNNVGVGIIDAFTGRVLDGRRWSDGLHQSIEAMENINVSQQSKVIAKVTYQALFRQLFGQRLSGMTGTASADADELESVYGLKVTTVPTALPVARRDYPDVAFRTRTAANNALIKEIINVGGGTDNGRPCMVGTTSVAQSELLVQALHEKGIQAELLNASPKNAPRESEIIAQAGRCGVVTVATNMAGRGTDILLGGCSTTMSRIKTRSVLLENNIITNTDGPKIFPPSPNEEYFPADLEDDTILLLNEAIASIKKLSSSTNANNGLSELQLEEMLTVAFDTTEAEDDPEHIVKLRNAATAVKEIYQDVLNEEKDIVKNLGGLYVMGTNRHESSRIDQQLRGRAGRQGDPGSSRFFVSFEDDMFVIFGGDKLQSILTSFRVSDDMPIESSQVSNALDKVQQQVEEKYRSIRDEIFRFDEVLNKQRNVMYTQRTKKLFTSAQDTITVMQSYNENTVQELVLAQTTNDKTNTINIDKLLEKIIQFFPLVQSIITKDDLIKLGDNTESITSYINIVIDEVFQRKIKELDNSKPNTKPFALGRTANYIILVTIDTAWSDHLQSLENLKEAVVLRSYQGRDPVSEYEKEAFFLFQGLEDTMRRNAVYSFWQSLVSTSTPAKV